MRTQARTACFTAAMLAVCFLAGCGSAERSHPTLITKAPGSNQTTAYSGSQTPGTLPSTDATEEGQAPAEPVLPQTTSPTVAPEPGASATGTAIAALANSLVGTPFQLGGVGPGQFDNPGFVYYCYQQNGITVPRRASAMAQGGSAVSRDALQAGDIVVFSNEIGGEADFVGIYVGSGQFVSCNNPSQPTGVHSLSTGYWSERFLTARRYG